MLSYRNTTTIISEKQIPWRQMSFTSHRVSLPYFGSASRKLPSQAESSSVFLSVGNSNYLSWTVINRNARNMKLKATVFTLVINCTILMKANSHFSRNVYTISDRIWCNKHLRQTTTKKYENNGKGGYFRFDGDNNISYSYILSITYT